MWAPFQWRQRGISSQTFHIISEMVFLCFLAQPCPANRNICTVKNWKGMALSSCFMDTKITATLGAAQSLPKVDSDKQRERLKGHREAGRDLAWPQERWGNELMRNWELSWSHPHLKFPECYIRITSFRFCCILLERATAIGNMQNLISIWKNTLSTDGVWLYLFMFLWKDNLQS